MSTAKKNGLYLDDYSPQLSHIQSESSPGIENKLFCVLWHEKLGDFSIFRGSLFTNSF